MKKAMDEIVGEIVSQDTFYQPMKTLQAEYPKWIETNWQSLSQEDHERYDK